jgi:hypothetical protein
VLRHRSQGGYGPRTGHMRGRWGISSLPKLIPSLMSIGTVDGCFLLTLGGAGNFLTAIWETFLFYIEKALASGRQYDLVTALQVRRLATYLCNCKV